MPLPAEEAGETESRRACVPTKLARNYFQSGTSVTTGKIGFYAFIARTVCAGKISLKFAQDFSSARSSLGRQFVSGNKREESLLDYSNKGSRVSRSHVDIPFHELTTVFAAEKETPVSPCPRSKEPHRLLTAFSLRFEKTLRLQ